MCFPLLHFKTLNPLVSHWKRFLWGLELMRGILCMCIICLKNSIQITTMDKWIKWMLWQSSICWKSITGIYSGCSVADAVLWDVVVVVFCEYCTSFELGMFFGFVIGKLRSLWYNKKLTSQKDFFSSPIHTYLMSGHNQVTEETRSDL